MKNGLVVDEHGTQRWYKNGELHREDGPAFIWSGGSQHWYINGELHRDDGPAIIYPFGVKYYWYVNNKHITRQVEEWMQIKEVSYLFDEDTKLEFVLTFG